jgi:hypothetical protein
MNLDLTAITTSAIAIVPIIIALTQAVKMTGWVKSQFAPLASIAFGCLIAFLAHHDTADLTATLLTGVIYGLIASGLYSGVKVSMNAQGSTGSAQNKANSRKVKTTTYESVRQVEPEPEHDDLHRP